MDSNSLGTRKYHSLVFFLATIAPLMTVVLSVMILSGGGEPEQVAASAGGSEERAAPGVGALVIFSIPLLILLSKIAAIVGIWLRWYFTWLFHALEVQLVTFIMGLIVVISAFSIEFSLIGFVKLISIFALLLVNLMLRRFWNTKPVRERYGVSFYCGAHQ